MRADPEFLAAPAGDVCYRIPLDMQHTTYDTISTTGMLDSMVSAFQSSATVTIGSVVSIKSFVTEPDADGNAYQCDSVVIRIEKVLKGDIQPGMHTIIDRDYSINYHYTRDSSDLTRISYVQSISTGDPGYEVFGNRRFLFFGDQNSLAPSSPTSCGLVTGFFVDSSDIVCTENLLFDEYESSTVPRITVPLSRLLSAVSAAVGQSRPRYRPANHSEQSEKAGYYDIRGRRIVAGRANSVRAGLGVSAGKRIVRLPR